MTYEYMCMSCSEEFSVEQKITDSPLKICPACGVDSLKRLISSGVTFRLVGGGWASDNYASKKQ